MCIYRHVANIFIANGSYIALGFEIVIREHSFLLKVYEGVTLKVMNIF